MRWRKWACTDRDLPLETTRLLVATRYLVIVPVIGLALAAAAFFVIGGFRLIAAIVESLLGYLGLTAAGATLAEEIPIEVEIVHYVHAFLIGTVFYITAAGLYQLFIKEIPFPGWLRIANTEELETNLLVLTVVVLAVNFMGMVFTREPEAILKYGAGIALPIAALALFIGMRTWSARVERAERAETESTERTAEG